MMGGDGGDGEIQRISFVGFGYIEQCRLLCTWNSSYCGPSSEDARVPTFKKLLDAADKRMTPGQRQKLAWQGSTVYCVKDFPDGKMCYIVLIMDDPDDEYPERIAYQFLSELKKLVEEQLFNGKLDQDLKRDGDDVLSDTLAYDITQLAIKFDDHNSYDKLSRITKKTAAVKQVQRERKVALLSLHTDDTISVVCICKTLIPKPILMSSMTQI